MTLEQIEKNLPANMVDLHKQMYLENCEAIYFNEKHGVNLGWCECARNTNFLLISIYNGFN